jgi:hypothetical protein
VSRDRNRPPVRTLLWEWAREKNTDRYLRAIPKRAERRARLEFFVKDAGRVGACYLPCALVALAAAAVNAWPFPVALIVAIAPAAFAGRVVSEKRPVEAFRAWLDSQTT